MVLPDTVDHDSHRQMVFYCVACLFGSNWTTRYGERMASRWLDAARYADTNGYQPDGEHQMWR
jgi:hypothetical protein